MYYNGATGEYPYGYSPQMNNVYQNNNMVPQQRMDELYNSPYSPFIRPEQYQQQPQYQQPMNQNCGYKQPVQYYFPQNYQPQPAPVPQYQQPPQPQYQPQTQMPQPYAQQQQDMGNGLYSGYQPQPTPQPQPVMNQGYGYGYQQPYYSQAQFNPNCGYSYQEQQSAYSAMMKINTEYEYIIKDCAYQYATLVQIPGFDPFDGIREAVLTDEEKEFRKMSTIQHYDFYGRPTYSPEQQSYLQKAQWQAQQENINNQVNLYMRLSETAHRLNGEEFDEEKIREFYDPRIRQEKMQKAYAEEQKKIREYQFSPEGMEQMQQQARYSETLAVANAINNMERARPIIADMAMKGYQKIKESHDAALGFTHIPPEERHLRDYLDHAGALYVEAIGRAYALKKHDKNTYYARSKYKEQFGPAGSYPGGPTDPWMNQFADDDYVMYDDRKKEAMVEQLLGKPKYIQLGADGTINVTCPEEFKKKHEALEALPPLAKMQKEQEMKIEEERQENLRKRAAFLALSKTGGSNK